VDWINLAQNKGRVAEACKHDNEFSSCIHFGKFLDQLSDWRRTTCHRVGSVSSFVG